ncbi:MAG: hypothetical protein HQK55_14630 [Deltaproteobacteria bacterium]|nr:hypothetical protein [Deltaproteobacteria bacterium]
MEIAGTQAWIESARAAVRALRSGRVVARKPETSESKLPAELKPPAGLRSLEQTQDLDTLAAKGRIIDRYL